MVLESSSSLATFKDCQIKHKIFYHLNLVPNEEASVVMENGSEFHRYMEAAAKGDYSWEYSETEMSDVAITYLNHYPLPDDILMVEEPFWTQVIPELKLRCTFDLVYREGNWIVGRDYKTYAKAQNWSVDWKFQGRIYLAALARKYPGSLVRFEYVNVRQEPPGKVHNKAGDRWTPEECYNILPLILSEYEIEKLWQETQWVAEDIVRARKENRFYRVDRLGFPGCLNCSARTLCYEDATRGLSEQTIQLLSTPREPLRLDDGGPHGDQRAVA